MTHDTFIIHISRISKTMKIEKWLALSIVAATSRRMERHCARYWHTQLNVKLVFNSFSTRQYETQRSTFSHKFFISFYSPSLAKRNAFLCITKQRENHVLRRHSTIVGVTSIWFEVETWTIARTHAHFSFRRDCNFNLVSLSLSLTLFFIIIIIIIVLRMRLVEQLRLYLEKDVIQSFKRQKVAGDCTRLWWKTSTSGVLLLPLLLVTHPYSLP